MTPEEIEIAAKSLVGLASPSYHTKENATSILKRAAEILSEPPPVECPWPVPDCEPGYRWVRPGEKIEDGDEVKSWLDSGWIPVTASIGQVVTTERGYKFLYGMYRRKVTTKQSYDELVKERDAWAETAAGHVTRIKELEKQASFLKAAISHPTVIASPSEPVGSDFVYIEFPDNGLPYSSASEGHVRISRIESLRQDSKCGWVLRVNGRVEDLITPESAERVKLALGLVKP